MRKMTVLGASALLVAGLMGSPAAAFAAPIAGAPVAITGGGNDGATCPKDGKVDVTGEQVTLEVTAEPGYLITGYCVKAGSDKQGDGPVNVDVDPPAATVTISHPSGKAISHYTLVTVKAGPTPEPSPSEPSQEPSVVPSGEPSEGSSGTPSEPAVEPSGTPDDESTAPADDVEATTAPSGEEPGELAATGASTVIGFTLIALALVGGGVTLIVLRRKGVLGS
ncbi:LPXTG cell wall anchor domain-containing protein [Promicromonospora sp. NPDC023805]|uniref:LPXTG cell wall anchor domain-containing protein n=1 Tax=Promicromonospora sp. NPDC023805 TaxID=3154696 RepID=UPI0033F533F6